jgi:hypothetical protein
MANPTPTFVIHRKRADGWRSTFDGGRVASTGVAAYADACREAEAAIRAELGAAFVACDHHAAGVRRSQNQVQEGAAPPATTGATRTPARLPSFTR